MQRTGRAGPGSASSETAHAGARERQNASCAALLTLHGRYRAGSSFCARPKRRFASGATMSARAGAAPRATPSPPWRPQEALNTSLHSIPSEAAAARSMALGSPGVPHFLLGEAPAASRSKSRGKSPGRSPGWTPPGSSSAAAAAAASRSPLLRTGWRSLSSDVIQELQARALLVLRAPAAPSGLVAAPQRSHAAPLGLGPAASAPCVSRIK